MNKGDTSELRDEFTKELPLPAGGFLSSCPEELNICYGPKSTFNFLFFTFMKVCFFTFLLKNIMVIYTKQNLSF